MNKFQEFKKKLNETDNLEELLEAEAFPREPKDKIRDLLNNDSSAADITFAGLTFGDFIYDALRVNPLVIKGVDFSRSADLGDLFKFSLFSDDIADLSDSSLLGNINQIKGFVGEQYVAQHLQSSGYEVEFPSNPNNPGYDLIVDGKHFQIKTTLDSSLVQDHLDKYPKIPVFVNEEVASEFAGNPMVYSVPGFLEGNIQQMTRASIDSGSELVDYEITTFSSAVAAGRQIYRFYNGSTDLKNGTINFGYDVLGYATGAKLGSAVLATAGSLFAPFAVITGGLFGAVVGGITGKRIMTRIKSNIHAKEEIKIAEVKIKTFVKSAYEESNKSYSIFLKKADLINKTLQEKGRKASALYEYSIKRLSDEEKYLENRRKELKQSIDDINILNPSKNGLEIACINALSLSIRAKVHPINIKDPLIEMFEALFKLKKKQKKL